MLEGLREVNAAVVLFTRLCFGQRSEYLWENDFGEIHTISQEEGGEQGDAMMSLLYSRALEDVARYLLRGEHLFAFLDDTFVVSPLSPGGQDSRPS